MARAMQTLLSEAMKLERSEFLRAAPGERTDERTGYANGFKGKALRTRVGELALRVPQVRALPGGEAPGFYPMSLERGLRSERALKLAIAEMYVQGVSTRRVTEVTRELCGLEVTSAQVSRAASELDGQLQAWRERPLGRCAYLALDARYEKVRHGGSVIDCAVLVAMGVRRFQIVASQVFRFDSRRLHHFHSQNQALMSAKFRGRQTGAKSTLREPFGQARA